MALSSNLQALVARGANPFDFCDKDGNRLERMPQLQVGDTVYKKIGGKVVSATVRQLNPLTFG